MLVAVVSRRLRSVVESRLVLAAEFGNDDVPCLRLFTDLFSTTVISIFSK